MNRKQPHSRAALNLRAAFATLTPEKAARKIDHDHDAANFTQDIRESLAAGRPLAELVAKATA